MIGGARDTSRSQPQAQGRTELFDTFTEVVIGGILEFWSTLAAPAAGEASERSGRRRRRQPRADG
jgi:hypothetical protein